jgi:hypothetical protein
MPACTDCRFYHQPANWEACGECRRRAPRSTMKGASEITEALHNIAVALHRHFALAPDYYSSAAPTDEDQNAENPRWPFVEATDWCGEFEPKRTEEIGA